MLFREAYMRLINEKQTGRITVKDICECAELNRSTFYLHYSEPNDILKELEDETIGMVKDALNSIGSLENAASDASECLMSFLCCVRKNGELFRTLLVRNTDPHFRRKLSDTAIQMAQISFHVDIAPESRRMVYLYIVNGCMEVLTDWISGDFSLPEKTVCGMLYSLSEGSLRNFLSVNGQSGV